MFHLNLRVSSFQIWYSKRFDFRWKNFPKSSYSKLSSYNNFIESYNLTESQKGIILKFLKTSSMSCHFYRINYPLLVTKRHFQAKSKPLQDAEVPSKPRRDFSSILFMSFIVLCLYNQKILKDVYYYVKGVFGKVGSDAKIENLKVENCDKCKNNVSFDDVKGCDEVKKEFQTIINFLKDPSAYEEMGAKMTKGILLIGAPGVGKTMIAKAVATEANVPMTIVTGSEVESMFVGSGALKLRTIFKKARETAPSIIFIDEIDSLCRKRVFNNLNPYSNQVVNQFLSEMDGMKPSDNVIVIGATNFFEALDQAAIRPGRFDLHLRVYNPDYQGRVDLFKSYLNKVAHEDDIDYETLAKASVGVSGDFISKMVNEAAILCVKLGDSKVRMKHLWEAESRLNMGLGRKKDDNVKINELTAYHEAGHAVMVHFGEHSSMRNKFITILPHRDSGGYTNYYPKEDNNTPSKVELLATLDMLMGGRVAEEMIKGPDNISNGCSSDMEKATTLALQIVQKFSMSDKLGLQVHISSCCPPVSNETLNLIDAEVERILNDSYNRTKQCLSKHKEEWESLAKYLLKYNVLSEKDIALIFDGKPPAIQ